MQFEICISCSNIRQQNNHMRGAEPEILDREGNGICVFQCFSCNINISKFANREQFQFPPTKKNCPCIDCS